MDELFEKDPNINKKGIIALATFISAVVGIAYSYYAYEKIEWLGVFLSVFMFTPIWVIIIQYITKN